MVQEPADSNCGDRMDFRAFTTTTKLPLSSGEKIWREEGELCRVLISLIRASGEWREESGELGWTYALLRRTSWIKHSTHLMGASILSR